VECLPRDPEFKPKCWEKKKMSVAFLCTNNKHPKGKKIRKTISFIITATKTRRRPSQGSEIPLQ
jgi:hypothetical protein